MTAPHLHSTHTVVNNLVALRDYYQSLLSDFESKAAHAREQLAHIHALLVEQLVPPSENAAPTMQAVLQPAVSPLALAGTVESTSKRPEAAVAPVAEAATTDLGIVSTVNRQPKRSQSRRSTRSKQTLPLDATPEVAPTTGNEASPLSAPPKTAPTRSGERYRPETKLPLLEPYKHLSKIDAVAQVMREKVGQIVHMDEIIHRLYGELSPAELKLERGRMRNALNSGIKRQRWVKVKGRELSYTLDPKLLKSSNAKSAAKSTPIQPDTKVTARSTGKTANQEKPSGKHQSRRGTAKSAQAEQAAAASPENGQGMRPEYTGKTLVESVEKVLQTRRGQPMTADEIVQTLYTNVEPNNLAVLKKRLSGAFSKGIAQKRWQRVRGRLGTYILA